MLRLINEHKYKEYSSYSWPHWSLVVFSWEPQGSYEVRRPKMSISKEFVGTKEFPPHTPKTRCTSKHWMVVPVLLGITTISSRTPIHKTIKQCKKHLTYWINNSPYLSLLFSEIIWILILQFPSEASPNWEPFCPPLYQLYLTNDSGK